VTVGGVAPGGPADQAGLRPGDVIIELAGRKTPGLRALRQVLAKCAIGQKVTVKVRRGEQQIEVELALGAA
jgi:S1-C subfamily serine protease